MGNTVTLTIEPPEGSKLLEIRGLEIGFGHADAIVEDVHLSIDRGEVVGLFGPSGTGKSLTLWSLIGLLPDGAYMSGKITFYNDAGEQSDISQRSGHYHWIRQKVRMIPQNPFTSLNPVLRCGDQIAEMPSLRAIDRGQRKERILQHLRDLGFGDPERIFEAYPFELSGGQLQRIVIAMATVDDPDLILGDEPTTALDVQTQKEVLDLLKNWVSRKEKSLLIVSHDLALLAAYCRRIYEMQDGRIVAERIPEELASGFGNVQGSRTPAGDMQEVLCSVEGLSVRYRGRSGRFVDALQNITFDVLAGEILGVAGATGCGKSTIAKALTGLVTPWQGNIRFRGKVLDYRTDPSLRKHIQMVFQDPYSALYPHWTVRAYLTEAIRLHKLVSRSAERSRIAAILDAVGLPPEYADRYPHELSGGERQRIQIARTLLIEPLLMICDEITSGLDKPIQDQILGLLKSLHRDKGITILMISHDLSLLFGMADRILVLDAGTIVESGKVDDVYRNPGHEVTKRLVSLCH